MIYLDVSLLYLQIVLMVQLKWMEMVMSKWMVVETAKKINNKWFWYQEGWIQWNNSINGRNQ